METDPQTSDDTPSDLHDAWLRQGQTEWARWRPEFVAALEAGPGISSIESIEEGINANRLIFWAAPGTDCAYISRVEEWPHAKIMTVCLAAGAYRLPENIEKAERDIAHLAKLMGCSHLAVESNEPNVAALEARGYKQLFCTMFKTIGPLPLDAGLEGTEAPHEPAQVESLKAATG